MSVLQYPPFSTNIPHIQQAEFGTESVIYAQSLLICVGRWQSAEAKKYSEKCVTVKPLDVFNVAAGSWTVYTSNVFLNG